MTYFVYTVNGDYVMTTRKADLAEQLENDGLIVVEVERNG